MIGRTVGKYRIVEKLGRGGMGLVYKAIDETLDRVVAIKTLNPDLLEDEAIKRFRAEAVTVARLNHPGIAAVYELTREGDSLLMVMEFVNGETFEHLVTRMGRLPIDHATSLCASALEALQYAHAAGVIHRDLKPANLMVTPSGDVKVMDFGIARVVGSEHLTSDGFMMGTPAYMAPEQVRGLEIDHRADLYAIAVVLYRLLTGRLPFKADTPIAMIQSQLSDAPTPPRELRAELPEWLDDMLARALSKTPDDRFQTAEDFRVALEEGLGRVSSARVDTQAYVPEPLLDTAPAVTPSGMRMPAPVPQRPRTRPVPQPVATPTPTAVRVARGETTVTLRTPHLAVAGALFALLVVGVGVLAYVALRRPPVIAGVTSSVPQPTSELPAAPAPTPPLPAAPQPPAPVVTAPPAPAAEALPQPPSAGATPPTRPTAPAQPRVLTPPTALAADGTRPQIPGPPKPGEGGPGSLKPAAGAPAPAKAGEDTSATAPIAAPAAANHPRMTFSEVRVLVADGSKSKEQEVSLNLESGGIVVRDGKDDQIVKALPYQSVLSATYSESKRPQWKAAAGVAGVPSAFGGSGSLLQRSKHWLVLQSKDDFLILRLEKENVAKVLPAIESRTGVHVQTVVTDNK